MKNNEGVPRGSGPQLFTDKLLIYSDVLSVLLECIGFIIDDAGTLVALSPSYSPCQRHLFLGATLRVIILCVRADSTVCEVVYLVSLEVTTRRGRAGQRGATPMRVLRDFHMRRQKGRGT